MKDKSSLDQHSLYKRFENRSFTRVLQFGFSEKLLIGRKYIEAYTNNIIFLKINQFIL